MGIDWDRFVLGPVVDVFGDEAQYTPAGGEPFDIAGVYDEAYKGVVLAGGMAVDTTGPMIGVRRALFVNMPQQGDLVRIKNTGELFEVKDVQPDGHGDVKLLLNFIGG